MLCWVSNASQDAHPASFVFRIVPTLQRLVVQVVCPRRAKGKGENDNSNIVAPEFLPVSVSFTETFLLLFTATQGGGPGSQQEPNRR